MKSISFLLLLRLTLSDLRLYFVSVLQNISVSISVSLNEIIYISVSVSVSVNEYNTVVHVRYVNPAYGCQIEINCVCVCVYSSVLYIIH